MKFYIRIALMCCIFAYIVCAGHFVGLANDYETIGYGLVPFIALPAAVVMLILAYASYRLAFVDYPEDIDSPNFPDFTHLTKE